MASWRDTCEEFNTLGIPILLGLCIAALFAMPGQMHEIYRAIAQESVIGKAGATVSYWELIVACVGIVAVSLALWLTARQSIILAYQVDQPVDIRDQGIISVWVPRVLAMIPPAATAVGLWKARYIPEGKDRLPLDQILQSVFMPQYIADGAPESLAKELADLAVKKLTHFNQQLIMFAIGLIVVALFVLTIVVLLDRSKRLWALLRPRRLYDSWISLLFVLAGAALILLFVMNAVVLPQQIGIVGLICLFLCFLLFAIAQLHNWGRRFNAPLIAITILVAVLISALDWNDNHTIRQVQTAAAREVKQSTIGHAFQTWLNERKDRARYQTAQQRYPVFVIAAQGGGIYAAHHVAGFLADMQDLCPNFSQHVFAISGVSGGSVGAAAFVGLTREIENLNRPVSANHTCFEAGAGKRPTWFSDTVEEVFRRDLISPLAASLFFPDFFQRFFPYPIEPFDRARALEIAFEDSYLRAISDSGFENKLKKTAQTLAAPFSSHWNPKTYPHTPALVLNTTQVGNGERRVVAPFTFDGAGLQFLPIWSDKRAPGQEQITPSISTAAILSARFPWVTPAASFEELGSKGKAKGKRRKVRLVDGGYFENSGVATAADIIDGILESAKDLGGVSGGVEIVLIVFSSADFQTSRQYGFAETLEPIRAMLNTQTARASIEIEKALNRLKSIPPTEGVSVSASLVKLELRGYGYPLPLGWRLSPITRHLISYQNGVALGCAADELKTIGTSKGLSAGCVKQLIFDRLK